ncbi:MAG: hypothetical protein ABWY16_13315, partial [Pedobacter sp.]
MKYTNFYALALTALSLTSCGPSAAEKAAIQMKEIINAEIFADNDKDNIFNSDARLAYLNSELTRANPYNALRINYQR